MLMLFFSNIIGLIIIVAVSILNKEKLKRGAQIPFGPAMILACLLVIILQPIIEKIFILTI
jgi:prepilin signal peptidase PulO-like enzyme (type II secretory pathway)